MTKATLTTLRSWLTATEAAMEHHQYIADDATGKRQSDAETRVEIYENLAACIQDAIDELEAL